MITTDFNVYIMPLESLNESSYTLYIDCYPNTMQSLWSNYYNSRYFKFMQKSLINSITLMDSMGSYVAFYSSQRNGASMQLLNIKTGSVYYSSDVIRQTEPFKSKNLTYLLLKWLCLT